MAEVCSERNLLGAVSTQASVQYGQRAAALAFVCRAYLMGYRLALASTSSRKPTCRPFIIYESTTVGGGFRRIPITDEVVRSCGIRFISRRSRSARQ